MKRVLFAVLLLGLIIGCVKQDSSKDGAIPRRANINTLGFQPSIPDDRALCLRTSP